MLRAALTTSIADTLDGLSPLDVLLHAFQSTVPILQANRSFAKPRHDLITSTPALAEREVAKHAQLANALADALKARGVDGLRSDLAAHVGMAAYVRATLDWLDDPHPALGERLDRTFREMNALFPNTKTG